MRNELCRNELLKYDLLRNEKWKMRNEKWKMENLRMKTCHMINEMVEYWNIKCFLNVDLWKNEM